MPFKVTPFPRTWESLTSLQRTLITKAYDIEAIPANWLMLYAFCPACSTEEEKVWVPNENPPREIRRGIDANGKLQELDLLPYRLAVASLHFERCPLFADCREELAQVQETLRKEKTEN
jgi:hypothetical protein